MEWKPRRRRPGLKPPWGYYPSKDDKNILVPDLKKLAALEYSFQQRAKLKTPIRDCCMWLHMQTGIGMTPAGFLYAYRKWMKYLRSERMKEIQKKQKDEEKKIQEQNKELSVFIDDSRSILALAHQNIQAKAKEKA